MLEIIKIKSSDKRFKLCREIRREVFVQEQGVSENDEYDNFENISSHYLLFKNQIPLATARFRNTELGIKIERFAVIKKNRNCGLGKFLIEKILLDLVKLRKPIYLNSQTNVIGFYSKFGFKVVGEMFKEAGIEHYKMIL